MIWEELDQGLIHLQTEAKTPNEIFEKLGKWFIEYGYSKPDYVEALKTREAQFPTGLDINGFGVAIPHTDAGYVVKEAVGILTLKEPVEFIQMGSDDTPVLVKVILMLGIVDPATHIRKLQQILCIIQDEHVLASIYEAKSKQEVISIIQQKEKELGGETL